MQRRQDSPRTRSPNRTRFVPWCASTIGVLAAANAAFVQESAGADPFHVVLLSVANAVLTGGLFALIAAAVIRQGQR